MNLLGTAKAAANTEFQQRVQAAVILTALDIANDPAQYMSPRQSFAMQCLQQPEYAARDQRFVWYVAANPAIAGGVQTDGSVNATDTDIHYVVSGAWHTLFPEEGNVADA